MSQSTSDFIKEKFNLNTVAMPLQFRDTDRWVTKSLSEAKVNEYHRSDIRMIPSKNFEIGDWVVEHGTKVKITEDRINYYNGAKGYAQYVSSVHWFPIEGEYCWSKKYGLVEVIDVLLKTITVNPVFLYRTVQTTIDDVEPFIGELPTFIKELK